MSEWKEYKLGDFLRIKHGFAFKGENIVTEENYNILVTPGNFNIGGGFKSNKFKYYKNNDFPKEYILKSGDIVVTMTDLSKDSDTLGYSAKIPYSSTYNYLHNQRIGLVQFISKEVYPDFIYWIMRTREYQNYIASSASGTSIMHTSPSRIEAYKCFIPPLPEQQRIASILSSLDDKIDLLHRENKTLEAMAETLFRKWFVEDAKEDWKEGKLGDYVNETIGGEWGKENPEGDFTKVVQCIRGTDIADLNSGLANKTPIRYVKESKFEKIEPRNGDIIMEISGGTENQSTGRVVCINEDVKTFFQYPIVFSNFCRLLRVDEKYSYFLYCYLKYLYDQDEYFNLENGSSGIKNLDYKALLYDLTYPMPKDKRIIFKFNDNVSLYFKRINKNKKQIQTLTQTRDSLLPKLMSGEIKV